MTFSMQNPLRNFVFCFVLLLNFEMVRELNDFLFSNMVVYIGQNDISNFALVVCACA